MRYAFTLVCGNRIEIPKFFNLLQKGLPPKDRSSVGLLFGVSKNPAVINGRGIGVDISYQSASGNFNALKTIANDFTANSELKFVKTGEGLDSNHASVTNGLLVLTPARKTKYFNGKDFSLTPKDFVGWTTYPPENPPSITEYPAYSTEKVTRANVLADQTDLMVVITIYHELRAHALLSQTGRKPSLGNHGLPLVEAEVKAAESEAQTNFYL